MGKPRISYVDPKTVKDEAMRTEFERCAREGTPRPESQAIRAHVPALVLGGWANPHADAERQAVYLADPRFSAEFFLTQVVSHHDLRAVARFVEALDRQQVALPGLVGVFFYRSANPKTLEALRQFLPVPAEALAREFAAGATPEEVCARTLRALRSAGVRHVYVSNLPVGRARQTLARIVDLANRLESATP